MINGTDQAQIFTAATDRDRKVSRKRASKGGVTASAAVPTTQTGTRSAGDGTPRDSVGGKAALASVKTPVTVGGDESGTAASSRPSGANITVWLPDHLRVLRETVDATVRPGLAASGLVLLIQAYLLCAEMLARQLVAALPDGDRTAP